MVAKIADTYVVAVKSNWEAPLRTHDEVANIQFYQPPPMPDPPTGVDRQILDLTTRACHSTTAMHPQIAQQVDQMRAELDGMRNEMRENLELIRQLVQQPGVDAGSVIAQMQRMQERSDQLDNLAAQLDNPAAAEIDQYKQQVEQLIQ